MAFLTKYFTCCVNSNNIFLKLISCKYKNEKINCKTKVSLKWLKIGLEMGVNRRGGMGVRRLMRVKGTQEIGDKVESWKE